MPLPRLVSPPPDARMPNSFEDREAQARLKLHLLMARLRTGFRSLMDRRSPGVIPNWKRNLRDETDQVLVHIGVCAANGFRIQIPYLVKDLADMMYDVDRPRLPEDNTVPGSINMDFNGEEDRNILASTKAFCYWWNVPRVSDVDVVSEEELPRVTRSVTAAHFKAFLKNSTAVQLEKVRKEGKKNVEPRPPVPGLASRPSPPLPQKAASTAAPDNIDSATPTCPSCAPLREALRQAHEELKSAQIHINGAFTLAAEAMERSSMKVDAYEILDKVRRKHGIPFENGQPLPEEYKNYIPLHRYHDGIVRGVERRAAWGVDREGTEATTASLSDGSHRDRAHDAGIDTPFESDESDESIPEQFRPRNSDESEESSENASHGESDQDKDWEMHPKTEGDEYSTGEEGSEG